MVQVSYAHPLYTPVSVFLEEIGKYISLPKRAASNVTHYSASLNSIKNDTSAEDIQLLHFFLQDWYLEYTIHGATGIAHKDLNYVYKLWQMLHI